MNRLLFGNGSNKAALKMWNFCHWMESSRSLAEVRFQLNRALGQLHEDINLHEVRMWPRRDNWSCTEEEFNLHKSHL